MTVGGHHVPVIAWNEPGGLTSRGTVVVIAGRGDLARARLRSGTGRDDDESPWAAVGGQS